MSHMEESIKAQTGFGFTDKDVDDIRRCASILVHVRVSSLPSAG